MLLTAADSEHSGNHDDSFNTPLVQTSIPDEDMEELITDLDVLAEVALPSKPSSFHIICNISVS